MAWPVFKLKPLARAQAWNKGSVTLESLAEACYQVRVTPQDMVVGAVSASEGSRLRPASLCRASEVMQLILVAKWVVTFLKTSLQHPQAVFRRVGLCHYSPSLG